MAQRSTEEVLRDHLDRAQQGDVEGDIQANFSPDCVLMTSFGVFRGHDGVRDAAQLLDRQIGPARYEYVQTCWHEELGFLEWSARTEKAVIDDGADSYWVRDGRIRAMTIHYTVRGR